MVRARFRSVNSWDDLPPVPVIGARLGATAPTLAIFTGQIEQYTFDATNDYIIGATEFVHTYEQGSQFDMHVHWATNGTELVDKYVNFQIKYSILIPMQAAGAQQTISTGDILIPAGTPDRYFEVTTVALILGTNIVIGSYIVFRFERIASVGAAPAANPFVIAVGAHASQDSTGSMQRFVK